MSNSPPHPARSQESSGLDWKIQEELSDWINMIRLDKTDAVQSQNEIPSAFHLLLNGLLGIYRTVEDNKRLLVHKIHTGETIGVTQMIRRTPSPFNVIPIKESIALRGTRADLDRFRGEWPEELTRAILNENKIFKSTSERVQNIYGEPIQTRIARTLLELTDDIGRSTENGLEIVTKLNRKEISNMVGCTLESVSRVMADWERQGTISTDHKHITVCKPHRLQSIVSSES